MRTLVEVRHRHRDQLLSRDLSAELAAEAQRRALHVRAVHRTWGVAVGFGVEPAESAGEIVVGPGFGYDCRGRPIVSAESTTVPFPTADGPADLVVSAGCGARFAWREPGRACDDELVLARGERTEAGRPMELELSARVWCQSPGFRLAAGIADVSLDRQIWVSTSSAAFRGDPVYFATLETESQLAATLEITDEFTSEFSVVLRAPASQWDGILGMDAPARVHWTGVERLPWCGISDAEGEER